LAQRWNVRPEKRGSGASRCSPIVASPTRRSSRLRSVQLASGATGVPSRPATVGRASSWWIGDWVRYGTARYGDRYAKAAQLTGYDVQSLMNMAYVAGRFSVSRRRERLSFSHHAELAALPQDDQELWLDRAEAGLLSVRTLRAELRAVRSKVAGRPAHELVCPECGHRFGAAPPVSEAL